MYIDTQLSCNIHSMLPIFSFKCVGFVLHFSSNNLVYFQENSKALPGQLPGAKYSDQTAGWSPHSYGFSKGMVPKTLLD